MMKCIAPAPCKLLGIGDFMPGIEYPLPDAAAEELIATRDPNWEQVRTKSKTDGDPDEDDHSKKRRK